MTMQAKLFGRRLMRARKNRQFTQLQLAERIGTSATTVSRYENGLSFPSRRRLNEIAHFLEVDIDWLLTGIKED